MEESLPGALVVSMRKEVVARRNVVAAFNAVEGYAVLVLKSCVEYVVLTEVSIEELEDG